MSRFKLGHESESVSDQRLRQARGSARIQLGSFVLQQRYYMRMAKQAKDDRRYDG